MVATAKLVDVKTVLSAPVIFRSRRKATREARVAYVAARLNFDDRATSATWSRLVAASRQLHAIVNSERKQAEAHVARQLEGLRK